ncbi:MAG TPA: BTAD domain-containing putative transcriptional regulator [Acidimicrobiales bacterium]
MFQVSVLGPIEVRRYGRLLSVPGGKTSELLVRLALDAGELVRTDRLLDDLWAAGGVTTRRNTLQSKVAKLRRALGDPPVIVSGNGGYALDVEPSDVDALAVLAQTAAAGQLAEDGDDRAAADLCASTLTLFRGEVLPAAGDGDWIEAHRARLESARVTLVETQFSARLRLGDAGDLIGELEAAVRSSPFQEDLWALLITAQYRAGRQADALASYQRVRRQLADELGLEPGRQLQDLEQRILTQDASLGVPDLPARARSTVAIPGNLPSLTPELVGRESEIAALCERIATKRLIEIVGPGGIGKTAVAVEVGRRLATADGAGAGGVWLARLETAVTADDVVDTLIAALDVPGGEAAMFERLKSATGLVILDNCEHVLDAAAALVGQLLDAAPDLRVLCTTQVPLDIDGEVLVDLAPLPLADAVELFGQRAAAPRPGHGSGGEEAVEDLCRSLDGLPLAIELAAARTRTLSVEEITRRLDDRFPVLSDPTSRRPERRRALKATIRWSYELLFPDDQRGLWALATFAGGAPLAAVEYVLAALDVPVAAAMDVVGRLASRSLVIVDDDPASRSVRYRLLDSIRAYALEALDEEGRTEHAVAAHAAWFETAAGSSTEGVRSRHQAEHLAFARAERANIDVALSWSADRDPLVGLHLVNGFGWAWIVLGDSRGAQRSLTALAAAGDSAPSPDRADALLLAAWIEASTGHLALAREHIAAATELADGLDDVERQARCAYYLAYVVSHDGEFRLALELTDRSRALLDQLNRPWEQAANALFAARAAISAGEQERSVEAADQVEHWLGLVEDPWLHVRGEAMLGELARIQHRFDDAVLHIGQAAATSGRLGFQQTEAYQVASLGRAQCQAGDYETGAATLALAIDKAEATGDVRLAALARVHLGRVLRALGQPEQARKVLEAAAAWHQSAGGGEQAALGECLLAALHAADGIAGAEHRLTGLLDDAVLADDAPVEVFARDALARLAVGAGDLVRARELSAASDRRMEAASHFITERDRTDAPSVR